MAGSGQRLVSKRQLQRKDFAKIVVEILLRILTPCCTKFSR
jgi:hypothetical protein